MTAAPCFRASREHPIDPGAFGVTVLEVGAVEHRPTAETLEACLHHRRLGRVEDHRSGDVGGEGGGESDHVSNPVPPHVVDTQVDEVGALLHLLLADGDTTLDVVGEECVPKCPRTVGIGPSPR